MKRLLLVVAVLSLASVASAQQPMGYTRNPVWQTPRPYTHPQYFRNPQHHYMTPAYPVYGGITRQRIGNVEQYYGTGSLQGLNGQTINFGSNYSQSNFNYVPQPVLTPYGFYYGW